jgi:uncharacterized GH25 family protein
MKRKNILLVLAVVLFSAAGAHEFWLQPQKYKFNQNDQTYISFRVGERYRGMNWQGNRDKVSNILVYSPSCNVSDVTSKVSNAVGDSLKMNFDEQGTYMITFKGEKNLIDLDAREYNNCLKMDGLDEVLSYRLRNREARASAKEYFQRSVKTIVQVEEKMSNICTQPTDLPLDIVPLTNPYQATEAGIPAKVSFKVYLNKEPLKNTAVRMWHQRADNKTAFTELKTNNEGIIETRIFPEGKWMLSCVYIGRYTADATAQWQSYWGTVTFGF